MIPLLRAIFAALGAVLDNQESAADRAAADRADLDARLADLVARQQSLDAAIEHLRVLVEGDTVIAAVGAPAFNPTGGSTQ